MTSSRRFRYTARLLAHEERGSALTEFALILPVLALLLVGFFDIAHTLYMKSVLQGEVQKVARDAGLESGTGGSQQAALDSKITRQVKRLANSGTVAISRTAYRSFSKAAAAQAEPFTDTNGNGVCDNGEPYQDNNNNSRRDANGGNDGQGGAKDTVVYTVAITYARMFPLHKFIGGSPTTTVTATTVMNNQPYGEQATDTPVARNCSA